MCSCLYRCRGRCACVCVLTCLCPDFWLKPCGLRQPFASSIRCSDGAVRGPRKRTSRRALLAHSDAGTAAPGFADGGRHRHGRAGAGGACAALLVMGRGERRRSSKAGRRPGGPHAADGERRAHARRETLDEYLELCAFVFGVRSASGRMIWFALWDMRHAANLQHMPDTSILETIGARYGTQGFGAVRSRNSVTRAR